MQTERTTDYNPLFTMRDLTSMEFTDRLGLRTEITRIGADGDSTNVQPFTTVSNHIDPDCKARVFVAPNDAFAIDFGHTSMWVSRVQAEELLDCLAAELSWYVS